MIVIAGCLRKPMSGRRECPAFPCQVRMMVDAVEACGERTCLDIPTPYALPLACILTQELPS